MLLYVYVGCCSTWEPRSVLLRAVNEGTLRCVGVTRVVVAYQGKRVTLAALVVPDRPLGVDMIMGMTGVTALGGVVVRAASDVGVCTAAAAARSVQVDAAVVGAAARSVQVDAADFVARFDARAAAWTVAWKWATGVGPARLRTRS